MGAREHRMSFRKQRSVTFTRDPLSPRFITIIPDISEKPQELPSSEDLFTAGIGLLVLGVALLDA